ncbi:HPr family phosphocarrier protein [bacterium]|nr:HPr family phosphocarrier protein [bacterium]
MPKQEVTVKIVNKLGLHARASATFVKLSGRFDSDISVVKDDTTVNGKSIMGLLMLAAAKGSKIKIVAEGNDAKEAVKKLEELVKAGFNED